MKPRKKSPDTRIEPVAYSLDQACVALGLGRNSLYREIEAKRLTLIKIGRRSLIAVDDVRGWPARAAARKPEAA